MIPAPPAFVRQGGTCSALTISFEAVGDGYAILLDNSSSSPITVRVIELHYADRTEDVYGGAYKPFGTPTAANSDQLIHYAPPGARAALAEVDAVDCL